MLNLDWHFSPVFDRLDPATAYHGTYNWELVATSVAIAIMAAFVALSISGRIVAAAMPRARYAWIAAGALSMGGGIWSMHFVGMLAFSLPCGITYDALGTVLSMIPGMLASGIALGAISKPNAPGLSRLSVSAVLMGAGIAAMHYSGMAAMRPEALLRYDPALVATSVVVAVVLGFVSLSIRFPFHGPQSSGMAATIVAASVMGFAIAGMHYTAMEASIFFPLPTGPSLSMALSPILLALLITIFAVLIAVTTLVATFAGRQSELASSLSAEISRRKRTEEHLRSSEAYLADAQRLTHTGSWAWDPRTQKVLYCSEEMFRIFGLDPRESLPPPERFRERIHPEDRCRIDKKFEKAHRDREDSSDEYRLLLPDGTLKHIHSLGRPIIGERGEFIEFVGTAIDVTERKKAEEALRRSEAYLAEAQRLTRTGSWSRDPATNTVLYCSEELLRIFGFDPREGVPAANAFVQRIHPEDRDKVQQRVEQAFREKTDYTSDFRVVLPGGSVKHIEVTEQPVFDGGGVVEYLGTAVDVTERRRAEEERDRLRQLEADLARMNRVTTIGEFTASLAHELHQPITAAITSASACLRWLSRAPPDLGEVREAAASIVRDASRAAEIINRLRSLYRKGGALQRELVDVNEIAGEMLMLLRDEADRHSIAMRTDFAEEIPSVMADRVQLQQVFMNLMLNGIEAMKETAGELTVRSQLTEGQLLISVGDTGVGLPASKSDRMFSAFFTTKPHGTGMGLAISRSIIESHGGRLWAASNPGPGATFYFTLPRDQASHA